MKQVLTILLASSLALATSAYAKPDDAKKKGAVAKRPPQQVNQQHVKAAPHLVPGPHVQAQRHTPNANSANVNPAKIERRELKQQQKELRKSNVVPSNNVVSKQTHLRTSPEVPSANTPGVHSQQQLSTNTNRKMKNLPAVQNQTTAAQVNRTNVAPLSQERIQAIRAQHQNFHARRNASIAGVRYNQNYQI